MKSVIDVAGMFWAAADFAVYQRPELAGPALLPTRLASAAAQTLRADGVSVSVPVVLGSVNVLQVPLGSSNEVAAEAERLQFTTAEGPCVTAYADQEPIMATRAVLALSWPVFAVQLALRTPFRSVYATPVRGAGVMAVYFLEADECRAVDVDDAAEISEIIGRALSGSGLCYDHGWLPRLAAQNRRLQVGIAMGMLSRAQDLTVADALAVLRAHAFVTDRTVDDVADDVVTGALPLEELNP